MGTDGDRYDGMTNGEKDFVAQLMRAAGRRQEPPPAAYRQALEAATAAWQAKVRSRRRRRLAGAMAACLVLGVGIAVMIRNLPPTDTLRVAHMERIIGTAEMRNAAAGDWASVRDESRPLTMGNQLRTGLGSRAGVVLGSGVSLRLAEETVVALDSPTRVRVVTGKVYLDTAMARGDGGRIEVVTEAGTAWDVGTQFEVRYRDAAYRLRVREGEVLIRRGPEQIANRAGEQLTIDSAGTFQRTRIAQNDPEWEWVESVAPAPDIEGQPVAVLLDWVARETGRTVRFAGPDAERKAATTILHGNIRHLAPLEALTVMLGATDLGYAILEDGTIVIRSDAGR